MSDYNKWLHLHLYKLSLSYKDSEIPPLYYNLFLASHFTHRIQSSVASYLDVPRIHFTGNFRADPNTGNNNKCSYIPGYQDTNLNDNWNINGTNEIDFYDTDIGAVDYSSFATIPEENDPVLSAFIVTNLKRPFAKLTDLDVDAQHKSTIYGMKFGISWGYNKQGEHQLAFIGKWTPSVIAQDIWVRMKCFRGDPPQDTFPLGSQGTTILTDIEWGDLRNSPSLQQLKDKCESGSNKLSIRVSYYYYTRNYEPLVPYRFTLGNVVGTIGVYNDGETLNFGGDRLMTSEGLDPPQLTFNQGDSCYGLNISTEASWTSNAPFKLRDTGSKEVVVDLSNALPTKTDGTQRDIGELYLGYNDTDGNCLQLIEPNTPIPYMANNWLESGALAVYSLTNDQYQYLLYNSLMVIQKVQGNQNGPLCGTFLLQKLRVV